MLNAELAPLRTFVLAGGSPAAAYLHLARTICRRAERVIVELKDSGESVSAEVMSYINRLSDFLFVASRYVNDKGARDVLWVPGRRNRYRWQNMRKVKERGHPDLRQRSARKEPSRLRQRWSLIAINIAIYAVSGRRERQGLDAASGQFRAVPGRGQRRGGDRRIRAAFADDLHLHVPARRLDACAVEHAVPVGVRRQHRGCARARALSWRSICCAAWLAGPRTCWPRRTRTFRWSAPRARSRA